MSHHRDHLSDLDARLEEAVHAFRGDSREDEARTDALRARLRVRMTESAAEWDRSWLFRIRRQLPDLYVAAALGALLLVAAGYQLARLAPVARPASSSSADVLPIASLTPGATGAISMTALCGGQRAVRAAIPPSLRQAVLQQYRMEGVSPDEYELDYLITPELGGVADARNLWPQRYASAVWNARVKDDLERLLPRLVCQGTVDLATAQREIAANWIAAYRKYFNTDQPLPSQVGTVDDDDEVPRPRPETIVRLGLDAPALYSAP